ncbi:DUF6879 family protein [Streptomyces xiamenensis]|uniref:DUF6879 family protein n=1 Tax=Streptomyces xiamenensis TaxID=408015 RepID=UPI00341BFCF6
MSEEHPPALDPSAGDRLARDGYPADFWPFHDAVAHRSSWKLERRQSFQEPRNPSWQAHRDGDWERSLRLLEERRGEQVRTERESRGRGHLFHRVRVVERPLTPYLQWELTSLRQQAECGAPVRVVDGSTVRPYESDAHLPELVVLGGERLYHVQYTDDGLLDGAIRFTDPALVRPWERFLRELFAHGQDMVAFHDREVAPLPPPTVTEPYIRPTAPRVSEPER